MVALAELDLELDTAEEGRGRVEDEPVDPRFQLVGEASPEQHGGDPAVLTELAYLNQVYEEKFGFRFVVFVAGRPHDELLEVMRERLARTREEELETGISELVAIAQDRWQQR